MKFLFGLDQLFSYFTGYTSRCGVFSATGSHPVADPGGGVTGVITPTPELDPKNLCRVCVTGTDRGRPPPLECGCG